MIEFSCEAIRFWTFLCWEFLNHSFNFRICDWSIHIFSFFLIQSSKVVLFTGVISSMDTLKTIINGELKDVDTQEDLCVLLEQ